MTGEIHTFTVDEGGQKKIELLIEKMKEVRELQEQISSWGMSIAMSGQSEPKVKFVKTTYESNRNA